MSADRELLEAAARAAGIQYQNYGMEWFAKYWNPLDNDATAFRLAVKLQLTVCNEHTLAGATYCMRGGEVLAEEAVNAPGDLRPEDYAATRRAIVRAAAALGGKVGS